MLTVIEKVIFLQNVEVFSDVSTENLAYLAAIAEELNLAAGEDIYRENEPPDALYLVLEGKVRQHRSGQEITISNPGEAFGTWALLDTSPRVATATPISDCKLLRIDREDFFDLLADHSQITQEVFKSVVQRLRALMVNLGTSPTPSPK